MQLNTLASTFKYYGRGFTAWKTVERYCVLVIIIANPILKMSDLEPKLAAGRRPRAGEGRLVPAPQYVRQRWLHTSVLFKGKGQGSSGAAALYLFSAHHPSPVKGSQTRVALAGLLLLGLVSAVSSLGTQKLRT